MWRCSRVSVVEDVAVFSGLRSRRCGGVLGSLLAISVEIGIISEMISVHTNFVSGGFIQEGDVHK